MISECCRSTNSFPDPETRSGSGGALEWIHKVCLSSRLIASFKSEPTSAKCMKDLGPKQSGLPSNLHLGTLWSAHGHFCSRARPVYTSDLPH